MTTTYDVTIRIQGEGSAEEASEFVYYAVRAASKIGAAPFTEGRVSRAEAVENED